MVLPFCKLLNCRESQRPLVWWELVFGRDFPAVRQLLTPCTGKRAVFYPCPDDPSVQMAVRESGVKYRAVPTDDVADDFDDLELDWEDVQAHKLNTQAFIDFVRDGFGIKKRFFQPLENLHLLGYCPDGDRSVYASLVTGPTENQAIAEGLHTPEMAGCVFFPERHLAMEPLLHSRGIATVFLAEACCGDSTSCAQSCKKVSADISNLQLKQHLDGRMDTMGHKFADIEAENEFLKGELAQLIANIAGQVEPEYFKWIYMILASGSVSKTSKSLDIANSTFDKRLKAYASRGGMYKTLYDLTTARRGCGRKTIEGYNPVFAAHQNAAVDDPGVIKDLLSGLQALNSDNWSQVQHELIELVREELM